jgi:tRNA(Phe) wybutosine-synthesizing methylase Tyw3
VKGGANTIKCDETKGMNGMKKTKLKAQADEILKLAEESGVQSNYFFSTTFERYLVQLKILEELKKAIDEEGMIVSKEYVKGRKNLYSNPAVAEFNRTTDSANKTVSTLMKIIKNFGVEESEDSDPLMDIINGSDEE